MKAQDVTVVVVPRDHFSDTKESLESILASTPADCALIYIDGGSPPAVASYLRKQSTARGFTLVRYNHYLTPNQARNRGATRATTRYIVFVDNDVVVAPGWLAPLVECADATGAAVVGPLTYEGRPLHRILHFSGGDTRIDVRQENGSGGGTSSIASTSAIWQA